MPDPQGGRAAGGRRNASARPDTAAAEHVRVFTGFADRLAGLIAGASQTARTSARNRGPA